MDLAHRRFTRFFHAKMDPLLSRISKGGSRSALSADTLKIIRGGVTLLVACLFGLLSQHLTEETTIIDYRVNHSLNPEIWRAVLVEEGFKPVLNPKLESRILRDWNGAGDTQSKIFIDPEARVLLAQRGILGERPELWTRARTPEKISNGINLSAGLEGLEKLLDLCRRARSTPRTKPPNQAKFIDPREIHY